MSFPLPAERRQKGTEYEVGELLGRGNFSSIYKATHRASGRSCALKVIDRYRCQKLHKTPDIWMEKHVLRRCNHPNIVKMYSHFSDNAEVYVVMESCDGGELWDLVKTVGTPDRRGRYWIGQILNAMEYLRHARIVHRDLKAENVMRMPDGTLKLIDFGTAKDLENPHVVGAGNKARTRVFHDYVGTPQFMPPEVTRNEFTDFRSDTWSLGCLIYQILVGAPPFHAASEYLVFCRIEKMDLVFPPAIHPLAKDLICKMVVSDADARLGCEDVRHVKEHPYFAEAAMSFEALHKKAEPVLTLGELCLRALGRRIKEVKPEIDGRSGVPSSARDVIERMALVQKWLDDALPPTGEC